jgi:putative glycosyltransferase
MKLSVVATLYHSAPYIDEFYHRASAAARQIAGEDFEIVFVNDGSPDNSLDIAVKLSTCDTHIVIIDLSRNFGHHKAMMTGLAHTCGDRVFLVDVDLEEEPEWVLSFSKQMEHEASDVIYGVQGHRKGGVFERWSGQVFYRLFNVLSGIQLPENTVVARLMSRRYVDALLRYDEREVFIDGLFHLAGFAQNPQVVAKHSKGETTYTLRRKIALLVNAVTSFSNMPLALIFYTGLVIFILAGFHNVYLVIKRFFFDAPLSGWTSVMSSIWLLGGLVILFIGIVGIYLSKMFSEIKHRPYTIVRAVYGKRTTS